MVQTAENKNLQIYLHHRIARLYLSLFIYFIFFIYDYHYFYLFIYFFLFFVCVCVWGGGTRLDGLYPQAYDLISIFSNFMEVSNI